LGDIEELIKEDGITEELRKQLRCNDDKNTYGLNR
jgi:hypothetical protein